ncbi:hypothetical protein CISIN_1g036664mg, partial [Citrus sinensis]
KLFFILCLVPSLIKMTIKGGTKQACAVCKYQRRKCEKNCKLAKYFPANQPKTFQNVHRLYGVSSVLKILDSVEDDKKDIAMSTVIFESNMRAEYPVHGCFGLTFRLHHQLQASMEELRLVNAQLAGNEFCVETDDDVKPFIKIEQNPNYYTDMFNNMPLGIQSPSSSHGIPIPLQELECINSIHDDRVMAFDHTIPDHDRNPYLEPKAKEVSDASRYIIDCHIRY